MNHKFIKSLFIFYINDVIIIKFTYGSSKTAELVCLNENERKDLSVWPLEKPWRLDCVIYKSDNVVQTLCVRPSSDYPTCFVLVKLAWGDLKSALFTSSWTTHKINFSILGSRTLTWLKSAQTCKHFFRKSIYLTTEICACSKDCASFLEISIYNHTNLRVF